jgi:hypothetical protein
MLLGNPLTFFITKNTVFPSDLIFDEIIWNQLTGVLSTEGVMNWSKLIPPRQLGEK